MERRAWFFLGVALSCLFLTTTGWAQTTYEDPQGRFVIDLPEGWKNRPFKPAPTNRDAVSIFEGDGVSFLIGFSPGVDDPGKLVEQAAYPLRHLELYLDGGLLGLSVNGHPARWGILRTRLDPGMVILLGSVALGSDGACLNFTTRLDKPASLRAKVERSFQTLRMPGEIVTEPGEAKPVDVPSWLTVPTSVAQIEWAARSTNPAQGAPGPRPPSEEAQKKINSGDIELRTSRFAEAIRYYSEAIAADPRAVEAYFKRAWAYLGGQEKADYDKALGDAAKALEIDPAYKLANFARGKAYLRKALAAKEAKRPSEAAGLFDKAAADLTLARDADFNAVKLFPNYLFFEDSPRLEILVGLGQASFERGDLDRALAAYSSAYERSAGSSFGFRMESSLRTLFLEYSRQKRTFDVGDAPWTLVLLGRIHQEGLPDLAIRCLSRALGLTQDKGLTYDAYLSRSLAYANKGDFVSAIADADNAIKIYDFSSAYENRADIYVKWGRYDKAISDYTGAIKAQKTHIKKAVSYDEYDLATLIGFYNKRGVAHIQNGSFDKGIADFLETEKFLKAEGKVELYRFLASHYELKGDLKNMGKYLRKAEAQESKINK